MVAIDQSILHRMLGMDQRDLSPEVARYFLDLSLTDFDQKRVAALSDKANEGELTPAERDELSMYVVLGDFLAIMQSRARLSLKKHTPAA
jgi:hypothetical protein